MNTLILILSPLGVIALFVATVVGIRLKKNYSRCLAMTFLKIKIPRKESKEDKESDSEQHGANRDFKDQLGVMKQFFESLASIYNHRFRRHFFGQDFMSFEYVVHNNLIDFYAVVPYYLVPLIEKQITAFYPDSYPFPRL